MPKASWKALLLVSMLLAAVSLADDADGTDTDAEQLSLESRTTIASDPEWEFSYLWQLRYPGKLPAYPDDWPDPIDEFEFQDTSLYGRASQLRNVSFLTLAEFGQRRLFLGVNTDGFVGIHFSAFSSTNDLRYFEVIRLPYLKELDTDSDVDQSEPESKKTAPQQITGNW